MIFNYRIVSICDCIPLFKQWSVSPSNGSKGMTCMYPYHCITQTNRIIKICLDHFQSLLSNAKSNGQTTSAILRPFQEHETIPVVCFLLYFCLLLLQIANLDLRSCVFFGIFDIDGRLIFPVSLIMWYRLELILLFSSYTTELNKNPIITLLWNISSLIA